MSLMESVPNPDSRDAGLWTRSECTGDGEASVKWHFGDDEPRSFRVHAHDAGPVLQDEPASRNRTLLDHLALNDDRRGLPARGERLDRQYPGLRECGAQGVLPARLAAAEE